MGIFNLQPFKLFWIIYKYQIHIPGCSGEKHFDFQRLPIVIIFQLPYIRNQIFE